MRKIQIIQGGQFEKIEEFSGVVFSVPKSSNRHLKFIKEHQLENGVTVPDHFRHGVLYTDHLGGSFVTYNLYLSEDSLGLEIVCDMILWTKQNLENPSRSDIVIDIFLSDKPAVFTFEAGVSQGLIPIQKSGKFINFKPLT